MFLITININFGWKNELNEKSYICRIGICHNENIIIYLLNLARFFIINTINLITQEVIITDVISRYNQVVRLNGEVHSLAMEVKSLRAAASHSEVSANLYSI